MIIALRPGQHITVTREINSAMAASWKYSKENASVLGGLLPGIELRVIELSTKPDAMWVRVELPGRHPAGYLKIAGEEYGHSFTLLR
jgi:hypothetical protein